MNGDGVRECHLQELQKGVRSGDDVAAGIRCVYDEVVGEELAVGFPVLRVEQAAVPALELLDRLDVGQCNVIHGNVIHGNLSAVLSGNEFVRAYI